LFYDRRKGKYRQLRKPIKSIVSITALGQAVISAYLQFPSDARGRPDSLLGNEKLYPSIFNDDHGLKFFRACILIDRRCDDFVKATALSDDQKYDLRYYVTMLATCELCGKAQPVADDISAVLPKIETELTDTKLTWCLQTAQDQYDKYGGTDKAAKGREMENALKEALSSRYSKPSLL
jgi:hypothetical protein